MIYLRVADCFDARALAELRAASLIEMAVLRPNDASAFIGAAALQFFRLLRAEQMVAWVACDDAKIVSSSCAIFYDRLPYPEGMRHAEICGVYTVPEYRKRGFAGELCREVVGATRDAGVRKTFLRPAKSARSLYARLGFVDTELMTLSAANSARPDGLEREVAESRNG